MTSTKYRILGAVALVASGAALAFGAAAPAGAGTANVELGSKGDLVGQLVVSVPVTVTCSPFDALSWSDAMVSLTQVRHIGPANVTVWGNGYANGLACDGIPHTYDVPVQSWTWVGSERIDFRPGKVAASSSFWACGYRADVYECDNGYTFGEVQITG